MGREIHGSIPETAEIATQAALTGHLVLSTLHTNDAPGAITRLLDLGIPAYLVASTVEAVLAQRLVRVLCTECRRLDPPAAVGCPVCRGTGYRGRLGLFELLVMTDEVRAALMDERSATSLRELAIKQGMRTLREDGLRQVELGRTTLAEVLRVCQT